MDKKTVNDVMLILTNTTNAIRVLGTTEKFDILNYIEKLETAVDLLRKEQEKKTKEL
jgi:hypothetical protein